MTRGCYRACAFRTEAARCGFPTACRLSPAYILLPNLTLRTAALILTVWFPVAAFAQSPTPGEGDRLPPSVPAVRVTVPPQIDGRLDDAAWTLAPVINTFTQRDPNE